MTCDAAQNRLLALADPARPPDPLRAHLAGCAACRSFAARLGTLDRLVRQLPVPPADPTALAVTLDKVTADAPIITHIPTVPRRDSGIDLPKLLLKGGRWGYTVGVAASVGLAVFGWWVLAGRTPDARPQHAAAPRHELLGQGVRHLAKLSASDKPDEQVREWASLAADLTAEARTVYRVADPAEMDALEAMFSKAVTKGLLAQATKVKELPAARRKALDDAAAKLEAVEKEVGKLLADGAPPKAVAPLTKMAETAGQARKTLLQRGA